MEKGQKECVICGEAFSPRSVLQTCCRSEKCIRERNINRCRRWYAVSWNRITHLARVSEQKKKRRQEKKAQSVVPVTGPHWVCVTCKEPVPCRAGQRGPRHHTCPSCLFLATIRDEGRREELRRALAEQGPNGAGQQPKGGTSDPR